MTSRGTLPWVLVVLAAVVSVQCGGALAATLVPEIGAGATVALRLVLAAIMLAIITRPSVRGRSRSDWLAVIGFGVALAAMNWSFYSSLAHLPIGVAVTIEFVGPLGLAAIRSRRPSDLTAVLAAAAGVVLVSGVVGNTGPVSAMGAVFALGAGIAWACYIVFSQRVGSSFASLDGLTFALIIAAILTVPLGASSVASVTGEHVAKGLGIAVLSSLIPYSLELIALRRLDQRTFGILLSTEPVVAALAGVVVLGQFLAVPQLAGMALVVIAATVATARRT